MKENSRWKQQWAKAHRCENMGMFVNQVVSVRLSHWGFFFFTIFKNWDTTYKVHPLKVCNWLVFSIFIKLHNTTLSNFRIVLSPPKRTPIPWSSCFPLPPEAASLPCGLPLETQVLAVGSPQVGRHLSAEYRGDTDKTSAVSATYRFSLYL